MMFIYSQVCFVVWWNNVFVLSVLWCKLSEKGAFVLYKIHYSPIFWFFFKHLWCIKMFSNDIYAIFLCTIWDSATYPLQIFSHNVYVSCIFNQQNLLFFNVNFIQTDLLLLYPNQFIKSWGGSCCVFFFWIFCLSFVCFIEKIIHFFINPGSI